MNADPIDRGIAKYCAGEPVGKDLARALRDRIFVRTLLRQGGKRGKLANIVNMSRSARAPIGRIMRFVSVATYPYREVFAEEETLTGHTSYVHCVSPLDGGRHVSGSGDKTLIVWAAGDGGAFAAAQTLSGHTSTVMCVSQLGDRRIVSGSYDKTIKVWE